MIKVFKLKKRLACYPEREYFTGEVDGNIVKVYTRDNEFKAYRLSSIEHYHGRLHESITCGRWKPPMLLDEYDIVDVRYAANKHKFYVNFRLKYYNKEKYDEYVHKEWEKLKKELEKPKDMSVFGF